MLKSPTISALSTLTNRSERKSVYGPGGLYTVARARDRSDFFYISDSVTLSISILNECSKVRRKEGSGQGWLVKTQVFLFKTDKLTQVRTLRHPETSTLSFVSAITLCIRSDCFSLTARAPESSLRLSL